MIIAMMMMMMMMMVVVVGEGMVLPSQYGGQTSL